MKIEQHEYSGFLRVDVQTRRDGNSAVKVAEDASTEVYFGGLEAKVTLKDVCIEITMNPDEGSWHDIEWARRKALAVVLAPEVSVAVLAALCAVNRSVGRKEGRKELQGQISEILGLRPR